MRESLCGILGGSLAGAFFSIGLRWLAAPQATVAKPALDMLSHHRAPIVVSMLAVLALIAPRFCHRSGTLFRSWRAGMIRGVTLVWSISTFSFWMKRECWPLFLSLAAAFQILTEIAEHRRESRQCTAKDIAEWVPRSNRSSISAIGFEKAIENWDQDAVGRQDFVETVLACVLIDCEPTVAIIADFGEGKSSVLNLMRKSIERGNKAIAVPFRAWLPSTEEAFVNSLFGTATAAIRAKFFLPGWQLTARRYSRAVLGLVPPSWRFLSDLLPPESQFGQIEVLRKLVSRLPIRLVFLLDEIDRMHAEELIVLLKVLRGAPELTNISYVCAFSRDAVARIVSSKDDLAFGLHYLEKFFPLQLQLPAIDEDLRQYLFFDRIDGVLQREGALNNTDLRKNFDDARKDIWNQSIKNRITNFRLLGQVLRAFDSSFHVLKAEVNPFDLLVIECVRLLLPGSYEFVYRNGKYFHEPPKVMERWTGDFFGIDEQARKKSISEALNRYFGGMPDADKGLALNLLASIFPSVENYAKENRLAVPASTDRARDHRISDPDFFPRYFIYDVPATMFGAKEMDSFIAAMRSTDQTNAATVIASVYPLVAKDDLKRIDFLRNLKRRADEIGDRQSEWLAVWLAENTSEMKRGDIAYIVTKGLVFTLVSKSQKSARLQQVLDDLVLKADSDRFASDITYSCVSARQKSAEEITDWSGFNPEQIKEAFGERMRSRHPNSVTVLDLSEDLQSFSRWQEYVPTDRPYITEYFRSAFDIDIGNLGLFLEWLLLGDVIYDGSPVKLIDFFFPVTEIVSRLKEAETKGVHWSEPHGNAISKFWHYLEQEPGQSGSCEANE
jgi:hypothetical protein